MNPYTTVRVGFANDDYENACESFGGGWELLPKWRELGNLLGHRPGWHFEVVNAGEALWSLGLFGESRLNIHVTQEGRFHCHDHEDDEDTVALTTAEVEQWLADHDHETKCGPSEVLLSMARESDWKLLKQFTIKLLVSWSDGAFAASLPHHYDAAISPVLADAVAGAAEMVCRLFNAPPKLASELTLTVELDPAAARQLQGASR